jgi:hypothetical protein
MNGYPKIFNIEHPRKEFNNEAVWERVIGPALKVVEEYESSVWRYSNPPAENIARF